MEEIELPEKLRIRIKTLTGSKVDQVILMPTDHYGNQLCVHLENGVLFTLGEWSGKFHEDWY